MHQAFLFLPYLIYIISIKNTAKLIIFNKNTALYSV